MSTYGGTFRLPPSTTRLSCLTLNQNFVCSPVDVLLYFKLKCYLTLGNRSKSGTSGMNVLSFMVGFLLLTCFFFFPAEVFSAERKTKSSYF